MNDAEETVLINSEVWVVCFVYSRVLLYPCKHSSIIKFHGNTIIYSCTHDTMNFDLKAEAQ